MRSVLVASLMGLLVTATGCGKSDFDKCRDGDLDACKRACDKSVGGGGPVGTATKSQKELERDIACAEVSRRAADGILRGPPIRIKTTK